MQQELTMTTVDNLTELEQVEGGAPRTVGGAVTDVVTAAFFVGAVGGYSFGPVGWAVGTLVGFLVGLFW